MQNKNTYQKKQIISYLLCILFFVGAGIFYCTVNPEKEAEIQIQKTTEDEAEEKTPVTKEIETTLEDLIFVHVCGAVKNPGVYQAAENSRVYDVIVLAGGGTEESALDMLNLAETVEDGDRIFVPTLQEAQTMAREEKPGKIDLNKATKEELMTLSGIGESRAEDIILYRTENGGFRTIEDIMKVPGIKEAAFQKIKDSIMVKS